MCRLVFSIKFRKISATISSIFFFFVLFSLWCPLGLNYVFAVYLMVYPMSLRQCLFLFWEYTAWSSHAKEAQKCLFPPSDHFIHLCVCSHWSPVRSQVKGPRPSNQSISCGTIVPSDYRSYFSLPSLPYSLLNSSKLRWTRQTCLTCLRLFNVGKTSGTSIGPYNFQGCWIKTFVLTSSMIALFIPFLNNHLKISILLGWVLWLTPFSSLFILPIIFWIILTFFADYCFNITFPFGSSFETQY